MRLFWLTRIGSIAFAVVSLGCSGQNFEGAWRGSLPLEDAEDCRLRLGDNGRFDLSCQGEEWVGLGRWERNGSRIRFEFERVARRERPLTDPPILDLYVEGRGNEIGLRVAEREREYVLRRIYGR